MKVFLIILVIVIIIILLAFLFFYFGYGLDDLTVMNRKTLQQLDEEYSLKKKKRKYRVVASFTTTPDRITETENTIKSILSQEEKVDCFRINVPYKSLKGKEYIVPEFMQGLKSLEVVRCEKDWGPGTKLLPTLLDEASRGHNNGNDTVIIFFDDDVVYQRKFFTTLLDTYEKRQKKDAICMMGFDEPQIVITDVLRKIFFKKHVDILTGVDGALVRVDMLPPEVFNFESAPPEAKFVDDHWFSWWLKKNGVKIWSCGLSYKSGILPNLSSMNTVALSKTVNVGKKNADIVNDWFRSFL